MRRRSGVVRLVPDGRAPGSVQRNGGVDPPGGTGVQAEGIPVARTLGRHTNDRMISFYARTPSGFEVEYGWGGHLVDDASWEPAELTAVSSWGHVPA